LGKKVNMGEIGDDLEIIDSIGEGRDGCKAVVGEGESVDGSY
jgi:hypothetical protein